MNGELAPAEYQPGVPDWSTVHKPLGDLFSPVQGKDEWRQFRLTAGQIKQFVDDGFLLNVPLLTIDQCDRILEEYKYFLNEDHKHPGMDMMYEYHSNQTGDANNVLMHALGHWRLTRLFHDLIFLPSAIVHIALDDQTPENGALEYIPGSHRWNRNGDPLPISSINFDDMESIKTILTSEERAAFKPVSAKLRKGEASFHHAMSIHGSYGNRSNDPRRAAVLNYFADGVCSNTDDELLKGSFVPKPWTDVCRWCPLIAFCHIEDGPLDLHLSYLGQKMEGQFYPLVFDPKWSL